MPSSVQIISGVEECVGEGDDVGLCVAGAVEACVAGVVDTSITLGEALVGNADGEADADADVFEADGLGLAEALETSVDGVADGGRFALVAARGEWASGLPLPTGITVNTAASVPSAAAAARTSRLLMRLSAR